MCYNFFSFLFSTCVDEMLMCKGVPLCKNKNDLKACKMKIPNMDTWKPIDSISECTPVGHSEYIMPFSQKVNSSSIADDSQYHCLNRGDENPFLITNDGSNRNETWTQWVNTPCDKIDDSFARRCLGSMPEKCVKATCKLS